MSAAFVNVKKDLSAVIEEMLRNGHVVSFCAALYGLTYMVDASSPCSKE